MSVALLPPVATAPRPRRTTSTRPARPKFGPVGRGPHPLPARRPVRLTARGRALAWVLALAAVGLMVFGIAHAVAPSTPDTVRLQTVTVLPGQTAWQIAQTVNPTVDPRITLAEVEQLNEIETPGRVLPGQQLVVPVFATAE